MNHPDKLPPRFRNLERECRRFANGNGISRVVATLSGGADSVALLALLLASCRNVTAAHCNFHLRGDESMRDQHHVEHLCHSLGVELRIIDFDVEAYIGSKKGMSVEMACRELRHEWFRNLASELGAERIATGHNADDNIETLFLNLLRGSGTSGLRGMEPDNGLIWRPLLKVHRTDIIKYLELKKLDFITDSTNLESDYRRNYLRNEIIPLLREKWPGFDKALDRSVAILRNENRIVEESVANVLSSHGASLDAETIMAFADPELLVRRFIAPLHPFTTTAAEVLAAIRADKPDIRRWHLPEGDLILRNHFLSIHQHKTH